ncbi:hypothetical protein ACVWYG_003952, partial [Pedobacter sp. UYEF25]
SAQIPLNHYLKQKKTTSHLMTQIALHPIFVPCSLLLIPCSLFLAPCSLFLAPPAHSLALPMAMASFLRLLDRRKIQWTAGKSAQIPLNHYLKQKKTTSHLMTQIALHPIFVPCSLFLAPCSLFLVLYSLLNAFILSMHTARLSLQ